MDFEIESTEEPAHIIVRALFVYNFDPKRLAISQKRSPHPPIAHKRWTNYLSTGVNSSVFQNLEQNFATPIIKAIPITHPTLPARAVYRAKGSSATLLERIHTEAHLLETGKR